MNKKLIIIGTIIFAIIAIIAIFYCSNLKKLELIKMLKTERYEDDAIWNDAYTMSKYDILNYTNVDTQTLDFNNIEVKFPYDKLQILDIDTSGVAMYKNNFMTIALMKPFDIFNEDELWYEYIAKSTRMQNSSGDNDIKEYGIDERKIEKILKKYDSYYEFIKTSSAYDTEGLKEFNIFSSMDDIILAAIKVYNKILPFNTSHIYYFEDESIYSGFIYKIKGDTDRMVIQLYKSGLPLININLAVNKNSNYTITDNDIKVIINSIVK